MDFGFLTILAVIVVLALIVAISAIRIINQYERGVVFRLGRLIALRNPGLNFIIPFGIDRLVKMDMRVITLEVPPQEIITRFVCRIQRDWRSSRGAWAIMPPEHKYLHRLSLPTE